MAEQSSFLEKLIGTALGNYRLEQLIEMHAWGPLFLASDLSGGKESDARDKSYIIRFVGRPVVDASARPAADARLVYLGRFQQEANRIALLQHSHILPLLDYGNYHGTPYLVYPYMQFSSLRTLLEQNMFTDTHLVGRYLDQIATALEYAHSQAVLHRNLSTGCIFLQQNGQVVVAEFGLMRMNELSKQAAQSGEKGAEQAGQSRQYVYNGSSESSSPEQLSGQVADVRTDVYALGAVLYRMLTGRTPFVGQTREEVVQQHLYATLPPLSTWRPDLPDELDYILGKALAKEPEQRFLRPAALVQAYYAVVAPDEKLDSFIATSSVIPAVQPSPARDAFAAKLASDIDPEALRLAAQRLEVQRVSEPWGAHKQVSRRRFFALAGMGAGGIAVVAAAAVLGGRALGGIAAKSPATGAPIVSSSGTSKGNANVLARVADVPTNSAKQFPIANQQNPGLLIHLPNNSFVAFDSTCTHAGCAVSYSAQDHMLTCPCHSAVFDPANKAAVVQGPAPKPLTAIKITINQDGSIVAS